MNRKGFEFSFGWLFVLIVGAAILLLALMIAGGVLKLGKQTSTSFAGKELSILLHPLSTGIEEGKKTALRFPEETRVSATCTNEGTFGKQEVRIATRTRSGKTWEEGNPSSSRSTFVFAPVVEGVESVVFSKPLLLPFKVVDVVFLLPAEETYCFIQAPEGIEEDVVRLELPLNLTRDVSACKKESVKVCFSRLSGCDVIVDGIEKSVRKGQQKVTYVDDKNGVFLYGAIFADANIYECQTKRLMARAAELALLFIEKSKLLSVKGCSSNLEDELFAYAEKARGLNSSRILNEILEQSEELRRNHAALACKVF